MNPTAHTMSSTGHSFQPIELPIPSCEVRVRGASGKYEASSLSHGGCCQLRAPSFTSMDGALCRSLLFMHPCLADHRLQPATKCNIIFASCRAPMARPGSLQMRHCGARTTSQAASASSAAWWQSCEDRMCAECVPLRLLESGREPNPSQACINDELVWIRLWVEDAGLTIGHQQCVADLLSRIWTRSTASHPPSCPTLSPTLAAASLRPTPCMPCASSRHHADMLARFPEKTPQCTAHGQQLVLLMARCHTFNTSMRNIQSTGSSVTGFTSHCFTSHYHA
jgi:hypothetical protein